MASLRTTISCRLFAQLLIAGVPAALAAQAPVSVVDFTQKVPSEPRWSVPLPAQPVAPPLISGDLVYVALQSGIVAAYRVGDGVEVWQRQLRADGAPAAAGARLFVPSGEAIYALNADGSPAWHADTGALAAPMLVHDGWLVAAARGQVTAYRAEDGSVVWRRELGGVRERPSIEGTTVFLSIDDGRVLALDLTKGTDKWERRLGGAPTGVLPFADRVFVGSADKHLYCLDAADGHVLWRFRIGTPVRGSPAADSRRVYVLALDNALRAFDRGSGGLRWSPRGVRFRPGAGPVVLDRAVALAGTIGESRSEIAAFDAATGQPAGQLALAEPLAVSPAYTVSGPVVTIAAVTVNLNEQCTLVVAIWDGVPLLPIVPLTELPGLPVSIPTPPER